MESVAEVPEEASGLRQPRFWIRVFLLLDRLPAKANEPCLPTLTHTHTIPINNNQKKVAGIYEAETANRRALSDE